MSITVDDIRTAAQRIKPYIHRTPILTNESLNRRTGAQVFFKCENLQRVGAFKFRGACNAVFALDDATAARGVVTHSSGNHGAALALAAHGRDPAMPVFGAEPEGAAETYESLRQGRRVTEFVPDTVCDGLRGT